ncbi:mucosa-associated lymphoid tissue lymphoma translocation protein 1 isoform X1 [Anabas testudineus]|uniref:MALT paracaspase 1 n=1 Tax=Anabas testudineus TaxID=64144 RepID=A0A7N6A8X8_ANATE|nr:mucosa-associated lymphoid tissue lymphoma translocation protein 1 isoform X1 [Anabas testudineus]XP_026199276.1 mucosa-associated lymphoid tissue lymphoma translocation protein 1 isoform X1 [Anabas testudineus]XP_026199277.1 mucosa-associated lymphoid tissue lymphoma translocation protein 1 isoform X1 [Anabas testudineus]XP_026199278.1 mucosa-associated lymphoid tissue lymphoma translocation protein 1 isoform X1 [Anabas testudineus]
MSDSLERSTKINLLKDPVVKKLCEVLDKSSSKGWRKLGEIVGNERRFKVSSDDMEMCSLKVLELEGSPSRMLLRLMGDRGCTAGHLMDYLQTLGNSEALQCLKPSALQILIQPQSVALISGHNLRLSCHAVGKSPVQYQWFKCKEEVPNVFSPDLVISPVHQRDAGFYICRVNCGDTFEFSQWAQVDVLNVAMSYAPVQSYQSLEGRLKLVIQPQSQRLYVGDPLQLECGAVGRPIPRYQWHRNGVPIPNATKRKFAIPHVMQDHCGRYRCEISSSTERLWTNEVHIVIAPRISVQISGAVECSEDDVYAIGGGSNEFFLNSIPDQLYATDKVALLIGNLSYQNHPQLKAPMVDVYDLTNLLRQLNFKVVSLLDLTESEMRNAVDEFLLLLHKGVYGLLYYAGHGYENYGNSFMVPVDAPNPYRSANCLCVQSILKLMQEKETGLNVFLLDMCRKRNIHDDSTPNIVLRVTANIVFGYATCQDAEAFELSSSGFTNGVFVKFLKKRLLDDEKITVVLDKVAEDMGQFDATKGKQALEIRSSLSEKRALTDPIMPGDSADHAHSRQWAKAHELPETMCLNFDCGVQIKLGFAAEFSNVLVIYTHIIKKPEEMSFCQAHVTDFSQDLDVDPKEMNRETPEETGIYLLSSSLPQHCLYTRLSSLQKLREELVFTVCLQGTFAAMDDDPIHWTKSISIGKPLIARLDLHRAMRRNSCLQTCLMPHSPSHSPCHSPGPEHRHHLHYGAHYAQDYSRLSPQHHYLDVSENLQGAIGGSFYENLSQCHYDPMYDSAGGLSSSPGRLSIPIEASDDITELQTVFINSLQLQQQ